MLLNKLLLGALASASLVLRVVNDEAHTDSIYLPRRSKTSSEMTKGALQI